MWSETRPWGEFIGLADEASHKVKRIIVRPGMRLSYRMHRHRHEHWFVVEGNGLLTLDDTDRRVGRGDAVDIMAGTAHRVANIGEADLVIVEVQHGESFEEGDIVRLADDYGRSDNR